MILLLIIPIITVLLLITAIVSFIKRKRNKTAKYILFISVALIFLCHFHLEYYPGKLGVNKNNIGTIVSVLNNLNYEEDEHMAEIFSDCFNGKWNGSCTYVKDRAGIATAGINIDRYKIDHPDKNSFADEAKTYISNQYITSLFQNIYPKLIKTVTYGDVQCVFSPLHTDRYEDDIINFIGLYGETLYIITDEYVYEIEYNCRAYLFALTPNVTPLKDILSHGHYYIEDNE